MHDATRAKTKKKCNINHFWWGMIFLNCCSIIGTIFKLLSLIDRILKALRTQTLDFVCFMPENNAALISCIGSAVTSQAYIFCSLIFLYRITQTSRVDECSLLLDLWQSGWKLVAIKQLSEC